jgi:type II secretory pathway pseudopilin PulG
MLKTTINRRGLSTLQIVLIVIGVVAVVFLITCVGLAAILLPAIGKARETAMSMMSSLQLQQIEYARDVYANQYRNSNEPHPAFTLQMLINENYITSDLAQSPRGPVSDGRGDYWVNPILIPTDDAEFRIASYDRAMYEWGYSVAVCYYGEGCEVVMLDEFTSLLALPVNAGTDFDLPVGTR